MKLSIRFKLLIGFSLLLLAALLVQGFVYVATKNYVSSQISNLQQTEVNHGATAINNFFQYLTSNSQALAEVSQSNKQEIATSVAFLMKTDNYIKKITFLNPRGREQEKYTSLGPVSTDKLTYEVASEPFEKAANGTQAISQVYYLEEGLAPHLDVFTPIPGPKASVSGVIKMSVNLHQLQKALEGINVGKSGFIYVVDNKGRLIAHPSSEYVLQRPNLSGRRIIADALDGKESLNETYNNEKNVPVVAKAVKIPGLDWVAVLEQPEAEAFGFLGTLRNLFMITIIGSTILLLFIALYLSDNLTKPIRELQKSAQQIESGQGKITPIVKSGDEIESLSKSFSSMTNLLMQRDQWLEKITLKLNTSVQKLKEMDKLKDDFVSVASHELRTPMTAIKSYLSMALDGMGGPLTGKQRFYIDRAYISVDRLIEMVNDMLNISRIESGRLTLTVGEVRLEKLVQEVIDDIHPRAVELGVTVYMQMESTPPLVIADAEKIKEVLFNLIGNALKFTPKGGQIAVLLSVKDAMVEVKVVDTGAGIAADDLSKLFHKFGLLPGSYKTGISGTGLGLYICKSIIELHEGTIYATSAGPGKGSEFVFTLKISNDNDLKRLTEKFAHEEGSSVDLIHSQV